MWMGWFPILFLDFQVKRQKLNHYGIIISIGIYNQSENYVCDWVVDRGKEPLAKMHLLDAVTLTSVQHWGLRNRHYPYAASVLYYLDQPWFGETALGWIYTPPRYASALIMMIGVWPWTLSVLVIIASSFTGLSTQDNEISSPFTLSLKFNYLKLMFRAEALEINHIPFEQSIINIRCWILILQFLELNYKFFSACVEF